MAKARASAKARSNRVPTNVEVVEGDCVYCPFPARPPIETSHRGCQCPKRSDLVTSKLLGLLYFANDQSHKVTKSVRPYLKVGPILEWGEALSERLADIRRQE
jgi:hypothetical protein